MTLKCCGPLSRESKLLVILCSSERLLHLLHSIMSIALWDGMISTLKNLEDLALKLTCLNKMIRHFIVMSSVNGKSCSEHVVWCLLLALHLLDTRRRSHSMSEWSSTEGMRNIPSETHNRVHLDVISTVLMPDKITASPSQISVFGK